MRVGVARLIAQQLGEVGIAVEVRSFEFATMFADVKRGSFQLASMQTGLTEDEYVEMMVAGGRPVDGNRSRAEQEPGTARNDG